MKSWELVPAPLRVRGSPPARKPPPARGLYRTSRVEDFSRAVVHNVRILLWRGDRRLYSFSSSHGVSHGRRVRSCLSGLLREMGLAALSCLEGFSRRRDAFARFIKRIPKRAPVFSLRPCGYDLERSKSFSEEVVAMCYSYRDYRKEEEARRKREEELRRRREEQEARRVEKKEPARRDRVLVRS